MPGPLSAAGKNQARNVIPSMVLNSTSSRLAILLVRFEFYLNGNDTQGIYI